MQQSSSRRDGRHERMKLKCVLRRDHGDTMRRKAKISGELRVNRKRASACALLCPSAAPFPCCVLQACVFAWLLRGHETRALALVGQDGPLCASSSSHAHRAAPTLALSFLLSIRSSPSRFPSVAVAARAARAAAAAVSLLFSCLAVLGSFWAGGRIRREQSRAAEHAARQDSRAQHARRQLSSADAATATGPQTEKNAARHRIGRSRAERRGEAPAARCSHLLASLGPSFL
jgi:hypothetical protein